MHPAKSECSACVAGGRRLGHFGVVAVLLGIGLSLRKLQIEPGQFVQFALAHASTVFRMAGTA